jgi:hypothetical protein
MEATLHDLWTSHGFPAGKRLCDIAKKKGISVTAKAADEFVKSQEVHQLHAKAPKPAVDHPITTSAPQVEFNMDLLDMSKYSKANGGHNWILLVLDVFSRKAFAESIKSKSPISVLPALQNAIDALGKPLAIISDNGTEFEGSVNSWLHEEGIGRRKAEVGDHRVLGVIDSLSRFYKNSLHRYFTHTQSTSYRDYLPKLTENYNASPHTSLGKMTPNEAEKNQTQTRDIHYAKVIGTEWKPKFKVGDRVRLLKKKEIFGKGYEIKYSIALYTIDKIDGINYVLDNGRRVREFMIQAASEKKKEEKEALEERKEEAEPIKDVAAVAKFDHKTENILKFKEGVAATNKRDGLRERAPASQLMHSKYGQIRWG